MRRDRPRPPRWTPEEIEIGCRTAIQEMVRRRLADGGSSYRELFEEKLAELTALFAASADLLEIELVAGARQHGDALRYVAGPPVSADDLEVLLTGPYYAEKTKAEATASLVRSFIDPLRFPWVPARRPPTASERRAALRWTAGLWSVQRTRTDRGSRESHEQETRVRALVEEAGYKLQDQPRTVERLDQIEIGRFTKEIVLAVAKCDTAVRLRDGRLLAIECKVSNSETNSVKRLLREVGGKAGQWQQVFGEQVVTAAVLRGVFKPATVLAAQNDHNVAIVWEHSLAPLAVFLQAQ